MAILNLSLTLGPIVCGAFFCVFFFGIICMQCVGYLKTFPNDPLVMRLTVILLWILQLAYTACICEGAYTMAVTDFGEVFALLFTPLGLSIGVVIGSIIDHGVQAFFVVRIYRVTGALFLSIFLWTLVAGLQALSFFIAAKSIQTESIPIVETRYRWEVLLLFFGDAAMDLVNAAVLCWYLKVQRRSALSRSTAAVVDHLVVYTLQTGLTTSLVALGAAISFKVAPKTYIWTTFFMAMPGSFMSALLANINNRKSLTLSNRKFASSSTGATGSTSGFNGVIQISRSVVFSSDVDGGKTELDEVVERESGLGSQIELNNVETKAGRSPLGYSSGDHSV
ncbi:hypothetical protein MKEN_00051500 [Mycena kentingensis (nom. inval.)]|nr:hypothetical protein MKEN_00051500 [Mycena kentingensis (nom. inval.)]